MAATDLLILGGPGTGKSEILRALVARRSSEVQPTVAVSASPTTVRRWRRHNAAMGVAGCLVLTPHALALRVITDGLGPAGDAWRLLSGPDQQEVVIDLLAETLAAGDVVWPDDMREAVATRGFADRVRAMLDRARMSERDPNWLAEASDDAVWPALARFWRRYEEVIGVSGGIDYAALIRRATVLLDQSPPEGSWAPGLVVVDDHEEIDPGQARLINSLARRATLVAAADPTHSVLGFRGAAPDRPDSLLAVRPAMQVVVLREGRRQGAPAATALSGLRQRIPAPGLPAATVRALRSPLPDTEPTDLEVVTCGDPRDEELHVVELVRAAIESGVSPGEVAVIVRRGADALRMQDALDAAGIATHAPSAALPLAQESAVTALLAGLRLADGWPDEVDDRLVEQALASPLVEGDAVQLRRLARRLRSDPDRDPDRVREGPAAALSRAVRDPRTMVDIDPARFPAVATVERLADLISRAASARAADATVSEVLWELWSEAGATPGAWARRLQAESLSWGRQARWAARDIDAVLELFAEAERSPARGGSRAGLQSFVTTVERRGIRQGAPAPVVAEELVTVATAHSAKARQWHTVVVAGVSEGVWPAGARLDPLADPFVDATGATALADERRLFSLACSRAARHLVVIGVDGAPDSPDMARASRFLAELGVTPHHLDGPPRRPRGPSGLTVRMRDELMAADPETAYAGEVARRLARLARMTDASGHPVAPAASPDIWWGVRDRTEADHPLRPVAEPLLLSGSAIDAIRTCALRWFLDREMVAGRPSGSAAGVGTLLHWINDRVANGDLPPDRDAWDAVLDEVWPSLSFESDWQSSQVRRRTGDSLTRLHTWLGEYGAQVIATEHPFSVELTLPAEVAEPVRLRGVIDILLATGAGTRIVDLKTSARKPTRDEVARHVQLATYQHAVPAEAGADLVHLGVPAGAKAPDAPAMQHQDPPGNADSQWFADLVTYCVDVIRSERLPATVGAHCRTCDFRTLCPSRAEGQQVGP